MKFTEPPRTNHLVASPTAPLSWRPLQRSTRVAVAASLAASVFYLLFLLEPANRGEQILWVGVLLAEGLTIFQALGTWWTVLAHVDRGEPAHVFARRAELLAGVQPEVDVFITVCGEPLEVVTQTMTAARDMRLAHETWILDDGRSDALREACAAEGVGYLRRADRAHAKAGNVNAALRRTSGSFVLILDADHVPSREFLVEALPYLVVEGVAFVQAPQCYSNPVNLIALGSSEAQRIFYELVSPGKNSFNAVFSVGTNVIFRRSALEDIGGMHEASNSEDIWTSLELHKLGWESVYLPKVLARGLAPDNVRAYFKQQARWSSGGFEILMRGRLFRSKGLSVDQRLQYLFTGTNYLLSFSVLFFSLLPSAYLLLGISPIRATGLAWLTHYLPFYALMLIVTWLQAGGFRPAAIVTSIGAAPVQLRAFFTVLFRRKRAWNVTNSQREHAGPLAVTAVYPHLALVVLNVMAIIVGLILFRNPVATLLSVGWALLHIVIFGRMVAEALTESYRQRRSSESLPVDAHVVDLRDRKPSLADASLAQSGWRT